MYLIFFNVCLYVTFLAPPPPRGGSRIPRRRGRQPWGAPTYKFARFSQKLHEIKKILVRREGGAPRAPPLDPPLPPPFVMLVMWPMMHAGKPTPAHLMGRQTPMKTLPCPKLRSRAIKMREKVSLECENANVSIKNPKPQPQIACFTHATVLCYVSNFRPEKL